MDKIQRGEKTVKLIKRGLSPFCLFFIILISPVYALTLLSGPDIDGCYDIRVEGEDITYDVSVFSDLYISRESGKSWELIFSDSNKVIYWLNAQGNRILCDVDVPVGHYTLVRSMSHRIIKVNLENRVGRPEREVVIDLGEELEFTIDSIDVIIERDSAINLRLDNPLIYLDLHVEWDTTINAYTNPQIIEQVFKRDITGSAFTIEQPAKEEE
ncbi:hypothetical protein ACFL2Y_02880 [Candidatus Omnitrophota bacterium]